jgi:hypothetical protein
MQFNSTAALVHAIVSAIIGFGLAFYLERKLSRSMQKKSQKILTSIAMISLGYGLMATLNETVGFPLQGLQTRYDKLLSYILVNILILPIVLLAIAKMIGLKNKAVEVDIDVGIQSNKIGGNLFKYFLMLSGVLSVAYFGYFAMEKNSTPASATYDFYVNVDPKNCNSPFQSKPSDSVKFIFKKETNEIFSISDFEENGIKKQQIDKLDKCTVIDSKNWKCGGDWIGSYQSATYMFIDGNFVFDKGSANCNIKIVKR